MDFRVLSRWFIIAGAGLLAVGIIFWLISKVLPREIPGTLRFQMGNVTVSFSNPSFDYSERGSDSGA